MNEEREQEDSLSDIWFTNWEQQCVQHLESEPDYEGQLNNERDFATQKAWCCFQNAAASIAQLYKDRLQDVSSLWLPFQAAAGTVATLYKESTESIRRSAELGVQCGYQRRNKELLSWARKKRRHIRREDLISYLAGKALPPRTTASLQHRSTPRPLLLVADVSGRHSTSPNSHLHHLHHHHLVHHNSSNHATNGGSGGNPLISGLSNGNGIDGIGAGGGDNNTNIVSFNTTDDSLLMFKEALALSGGTLRRQKSAELNAFMANEFARHSVAIKRPNSSSPPHHQHDVNMDSPTHPKRPRFCM